MARGFAHVGVLRAFAENKIPIGAIYGTEMGALVGALYAADTNINHFEWSLARLKDEIFTTDHGLIGHVFTGSQMIHGDPEKLEQELRNIFGKRDIAEAQIPLRIEIQRKSDTSPSLLDKGLLTTVLRVAMAAPGFFGPGTLDGQPAQSASDALGVIFLCAEARAQSGGPVVLIDTATTRNDPSSADLVIRPDLEGISSSDFSKRTDAAFRGKKAIEEHLPELRRWIGLQSNE